MLKSLRHFFLAISALGYGFLGGGPSLWALGLAEPMPMSCASVGCTCMHGGKMKPGQKCCCVWQRAMNQKYHLGEFAPGACSMRNKPCGPFGEDGRGYSIPAAQVHTLVELAIDHGLEVARAPWQPVSSFRSYAPEPPTPVPD